jgi:hypothetical protein
LTWWNSDNRRRIALDLKEAAMAKQEIPRRAAYPAEKAREGEIFLRRPWQRAVSILGLGAPLVVLLLLLLFLR